MTSIFRFRPFSCGIALATVILAGGSANAQRFHVSPPHVNIPSHSSGHPQGSGGGFGLTGPMTGGNYAQQGSLGLTNPNSGGNYALGTTAPGTFTNITSGSPTPFTNTYNPAAGGRGLSYGNNGLSNYSSNSIDAGAFVQQPQQGFYQQPQQGFYQQPQQGVYQQPQPGYAQQYAAYDPQTQQTMYQQIQPTSYVATATQPYQIPAGYQGSPAGSVISYGGANYLIGGDGTMTAYSGATPATTSYTPTSTAPGSGSGFSPATSGKRRRGNGAADTGPALSDSRGLREFRPGFNDHLCRCQLHPRQ